MKEHDFMLYSVKLTEFLKQERAQYKKVLHKVLFGMLHSEMNKNEHEVTNVSIW